MGALEASLSLDLVKKMKCSNWCVFGVFLVCRREESGVYIVRESLGTNWGVKGHIYPSKMAENPT